MTAALTPSTALCGDAPACSRCGAPSGQVRDGHPWCAVCDCYLVHDPEHGDWTSYAEREYRRRAADNESRIAASAEQVHRATVALRDRIPDGWRVAARQHLDAATHTLDIEPPAGTIDVMAYLVPPDHGDQGWLVRVHGRTQQVDFPLYRDGGACAASFDTAGGAFDAAVNALHVEIAVTAHR
jgi:uncharacterized Zn finger protein (UPF0148 family)